MSDTFYVYQPEVHGTVFTTYEEIVSIAGVARWNIFWIDPAVVEQRIETLPIIQDAEVTTGLPRTLRIDVVERTPLAVWQNAGRKYLVDAEGVLFGVRGDISRAVVIQDTREQQVSAGARVDPEAVSTALLLHKALPERRTFTWEPAAGISFVTDEGWPVRVGDHQQLELKVAVYRAFREQIATDTSVGMLDVTAPERPYYRLN